uniref:hypothetical protein n=1 Tax=Yoonia sp. TaxID=2212373 RepID=UPI004047BE3A
MSYGTFSCTLEGFDDSFGTMKAIAEYFRDLAADDRYFGAEPPTPDVNMLAKIAEREITRRVDARTQDGGIVLRASQALAPAMPPQAERPDPVQVAAAAVAPQVTPTPKDHTLDDFQTALPDATADDMEPVAGPEAEDHVSSPLVASGQATSSGMTFEDMIAQKPEIPAHPDADSVAAKLQRIRAVVGKAPAKPQETEFAEDLSPAAMPDIADAHDEAPLDDAVAELGMPEDAVSDEAIADAAMPDVEMDIAPARNATKVEVDLSGLDFAPQSDAADAQSNALDAPAEDIQDRIDTPRAGISEDDAIPSGLADEVAQDPVDAEDAPKAEARPTIRAQILRIRKTFAPKSAVEASAPHDDTNEVAIVAQQDAQDATLDDAGHDDADYDDVDYDDVDYDDVDYDDADYDLDEDLPNVAALDGVEDLQGFEAPESTSLSDDEEAALLDELAEVERDFAPDEQAVPVETHVAAKPRTSLPETDDATMSHIMSQTDQALNEPEGNRRRNAIAQLKAAVAATEAARQLGDKPATRDDAEDAFRGDLKDVVHPSRPVAARPTRVKPTQARTERPRPAPLKLVASQRVDAPEAAADTAPVQPRRIAAEQISAATASSFAEFAEEMGATALSDLLEAAAAYTAFVEGVEDFSRPQIMKKVQLSSETEFSREDGLRSFGTLLRQGRISKVRNGRFQVSDETRFRPEAKVG